MNNECYCSDYLSSEKCKQSGKYYTQLAITCDSYKHKNKSSAGVKDVNPRDVMRKFEGGATRDSIKGKLSFVRALSPIVIQRYVQYLEGHRDLPDGTKRDLDNWKGGLPALIWLEGGDRHHRATWLIHDGFEARDNHGPVTLEDSLCGIIFNASGWLHDLLKEKQTPIKE